MAAAHRCSLLQWLEPSLRWKVLEPVQLKEGEEGSKAPLYACEGRRRMEGSLLCLTHGDLLQFLLDDNWEGIRNQGSTLHLAELLVIP